MIPMKNYGDERHAVEVAILVGALEWLLFLRVTITQLLLPHPKLSAHSNFQHKVKDCENEIDNSKTG